MNAHSLGRNLSTIRNFLGVGKGFCAVRQPAPQPVPQTQCLRPGPRHASQTWHCSWWSRISSDVEMPRAFSLCEARLAAAGQFPRAEWSLNKTERPLRRVRAPGAGSLLPRGLHPPAEKELAFLCRESILGAFPLPFCFASSWRTHGILVTAKHSGRNTASIYIFL